MKFFTLHYSPFIIFLIFIPLVYSEYHRYITTYTGINGQTTAGTPEFSAVTTLDDQQIDYYDSNIKKMVPRQNWMEEFTTTEMWKEYIKIREKLQQIYKSNTHILMETFNQTHGVHTYQRMCGCEYDDETGDSQGFDQYGYDGEDFISLDLKENRYITAVPQGIPTVEKWNNDREQLEILQEYFGLDCVYWLRHFLHLSKATFNKTDPPQVSLLQKNPDYYTCHVTGFLFRDTTISWMKNEQALSNSWELESGDTRPNGDGTFQRTVVLYVHRDEWMNNRYTCVVEHKSLTETIQRSLTEDQIKWSILASYASFIMNLAALIITVIVGLSGLCTLCKLLKKLKVSSKKTVIKKTPIYFKSKPSPEHSPSLDPLVSNPSNESSSPPETCLCESAAPHGSSRDEQNPFPEPSPSQFLTGEPIFPTQPDNRVLYKDQEASKDL